jgi:hypothetical protein
MSRGAQDEAANYGSPGGVNRATGQQKQNYFTPKAPERGLMDGAVRNPLWLLCVHVQRPFLKTTRSAWETAPPVWHKWSSGSCGKH